MLLRKSVRSQCQFVASFYNSLKERCQYSVWRFFFRCTRDDVSSVCFRVGSIAKWRIVPFRGEGFTVFCSNKHFVWCAVRSAARKHIVGCIVSTYSIGYVFSRVLISSAIGCLRHFVLCAGHANRALLIDVHVYCISLQTNTDS